MPVRLRLTGERALFARPEFRHALVSYDLITPHAARGIFDAIYWRPGMTWVIDTIHIMAPIRRESIEDGGRRILLLRDVDYVIDAHFDLDADAPADSHGRHSAMFKRAARSAPVAYLGRAGLVGDARLLDAQVPRAPPDAAAATTVDHGWLLHGIDFAGDRQPRFFRAEAIGGSVRVPAVGSPLLFG